MGCISALSKNDENNINAAKKYFIARAYYIEISPLIAINQASLCTRALYLDYTSFDKKDISQV